MRRQEKEIASRKELESVLARGEVMRLAMFDGEKPYLVPLNHVLADGALYFHCATAGRKVDILGQRPEVCFEVSVDVEVIRKSKACGYTTHYASVIGYGRAVFVADFSEKTAALAALMARHGSLKREFSPEVLEKTLVVRIDIASMTGKRNPAQEK